MTPQMLLQRVEVVTGGASAVYGSDAVTGAVDCLFDGNFNDFKAQLQRGISTYNDAGTYRAGAAWGTDLFSGRGHFEASLEHNQDDGVLSKEAANPWHPQNNVKIVTQTFGGLIVCPNSGFLQSACPASPLVGYTFDQNGVLTPMQYGGTTGLGNNTLRIGGDGATVNAASLKSKERCARD